MSGLRKKETIDTSISPKNDQDLNTESNRYYNFKTALTEKQNSLCRKWNKQNQANAHHKGHQDVPKSHHHQPSSKNRYPTNQKPNDSKRRSNALEHARTPPNSNSPRDTLALPRTRLGRRDNNIKQKQAPPKLCFGVHTRKHFHGTLKLERIRGRRAGRMKKKTLFPVLTTIGWQ